MTRARAETTVPDDLTVLYFQQRAGAGLIITEGVPVSVQGRGQPNVTSTLCDRVWSTYG
ncbi:hypothetical protein [Pseudomonas putida]|uniref:hypothetical protein n=1 Tax=Pseudomonas putida TaxID=303 RepID=UPI003D32A834